MTMKTCLISITASHYRSRIYRLMDKVFGCDFIFGKDDTTVKRMDISLLTSAFEINNRPVFGGVYIQPGICRMVKDYDIIINDLGILCLSSWFIMILAKIRGQKVITWGHGWYGRESFAKKWLKRLYCGLADSNLVYGNYARDLMIKNGFNKNKIFVIYNSLDYDSQLTIRKSLKVSSIYRNHFDNDNPVLLFIGRLTPVKKLHQLIESVELLKSSGIDVNCVFVGDGSMRESLINHVEDKGLQNNVWFYGACYDEAENASLIYNADICVAPGNIGLTAMHAMMFGCPCISHGNFHWQMPEFEAIKPGVTGDFFEHNNVQSLADTISHWFTIHAHDRDDVRKSCYKEIDTNWNPYRQIEIIKSVLLTIYK